MSVPAERRAGAAKETGPRLEAGDWQAVAAAPAQAHLGDFMIGTPAGLENTVQALAAGITTIGNLGQHFAFEPPGGHDDADLTETTVRALGAMARRAARSCTPTSTTARRCSSATTAATSAGRRSSSTRSRT